MLEVVHCTTLVQWAARLLNSRQPGDRRCTDDYSCYMVWFTFSKNKTGEWFLLGSRCHTDPHFLSQHIYRHSSVLNFSGPIFCALFNSFDMCTMKPFQIHLLTEAYKFAVTGYGATYTAALLQVERSNPWLTYQGLFLQQLLAPFCSMCRRAKHDW